MLTIKEVITTHSPFKKKPEPILVKKYRLETIIFFRDGSKERWVTEVNKNIGSIFRWTLYRNLWKWFYLRESGVYTVTADFGPRDSISMKTFNREDIKMISGSIRPFMEEQ